MINTIIIIVASVIFAAAVVLVAVCDYKERIRNKQAWKEFRASIARIETQVCGKADGVQDE